MAGKGGSTYEKVVVSTKALISVAWCLLTRFIEQFGGLFRPGWLWITRGLLFTYLLLLFLFYIENYSPQGKSSCWRSALWIPFGDIHKGRPIFGMNGWSGKKGQNGTKWVGWLTKKGRPIFQSITWETISTFLPYNFSIEIFEYDVYKFAG